jgi:hypothetical protein
MKKIYERHICQKGVFMKNLCLFRLMFILLLTSTVNLYSTKLSDSVEQLQQKLKELSENLSKNKNILVTKEYTDIEDFLNEKKIENIDKLSFDINEKEFNDKFTNFKENLDKCKILNSLSMNFRHEGWAGSHRNFEKLIETFFNLNFKNLNLLKITFGQEFFLDRKKTGSLLNDDLEKFLKKYIEKSNNFVISFFDDTHDHGGSGYIETNKTKDGNYDFDINFEYLGLEDKDLTFIKNLLNHFKDKITKLNINLNNNYISEEGAKVIGLMLEDKKNLTDLALFLDGSGEGAGTCGDNTAGFNKKSDNNSYNIIAGGILHIVDSIGKINGIKNLDLNFRKNGINFPMSLKKKEDGIKQKVSNKIERRIDDKIEKLLREKSEDLEKVKMIPFNKKQQNKPLEDIIFDDFLKENNIEVILNELSYSNENESKNEQELSGVLKSKKNEILKSFNSFFKKKYNIDYSKEEKIQKDFSAFCTALSHINSLQSLSLNLRDNKMDFEWGSKLMQNINKLKNCKKLNLFFKIELSNGNINYLSNFLKDIEPLNNETTKNVSILLNLDTDNCSSEELQDKVKILMEAFKNRNIVKLKEFSINKNDLKGKHDFILNFEELSSYNILPIKLVKNRDFHRYDEKTFFEEMKNIINPIAEGIITFKENIDHLNIIVNSLYSDMKAKNLAKIINIILKKLFSSKELINKITIESNIPLINKKLKEREFAIKKSINQQYIMDEILSLDLETNTYFLNVDEDLSF